MSIPLHDELPSGEDDGDTVTPRHYNLAPHERPATTYSGARKINKKAQDGQVVAAFEHARNGQKS